VSYWGCDNEKNVKKLCALGQWGSTAGCATRYVYEQVGVPTSRLHMSLDTTGSVRRSCMHNTVEAKILLASTLGGGG